MNKLSSQETKLRDSESTPLPSRHSVREPGYDAQFLAFIKSKVVVDPVTGCWLWQGTIAKVKWNERGFFTGGYALCPRYRGRGMALHRVVWAIHKGPQPKKMDVCHTCDVRHCCNPEHLWLGTRSENLRDMVAKRRGPFGKKAAQTHCYLGHELAGENLILRNNGRSRWCKTCAKLRASTPEALESARVRQRRYKAEKRAARQAAAS